MKVLQAESPGKKADVRLYPVGRTEVSTLEDTHPSNTGGGCPQVRLKVLWSFRGAIHKTSKS